jgi:peptidoglycan hydrolase-like protein with peptidoglycan-binding domain
MKIRQRSKSSSTEEASSTTTTSAEPPSIEAHPDLVMLIESGDTLSGAAAEVTGDWQDWQPLHELNRAKVPNPDAIDPGDELDFPQSWRPRDARPRRRLGRRGRLARGASGGDVRTLQTQLADREAEVSVNGQFDAATAEAVADVQTELALAPDGAVGANTAAALDAGQEAPAGGWVVEPGDSLGRIAERFTGDSARYAELWVENQDRVPDPDVLSVGLELKLPASWSGAAPRVASPAEEAPAAAAADSGMLSVERGQLTFDAEGQEGGAYHSRSAHWPGGASGVTIGRGYDMGDRSWKEVHEALVGAGVPANHAVDLADGAGLKGTDARDFIADNNLPKISQQAQKTLFDTTYAWYVADVTRISQTPAVVSAYGSVDFERLNPGLLDLVVDLRYRGDYTRATRQIIQPLLVANDVEGMARAMANRSHWLGVPEDRFLRRKTWMEQTVLQGTPAQSAPEGAEGLPKASVDIGDADPKGVLNDGWLNPQVKAMTARTIEAMQKDGLEPYVFEGYRSFARQDELYKKGNVTKVRGGGSWHNYGLAVDIVFWNSAHNGPSWDDGFSWDAVGRYGKQAGFSEWGGDWGWDRPHLEHHPGFSGSAYELAPLYHADGLAAVWKQLGVVGDLTDVELVVSDRYGWPAVLGGSLALRKNSGGDAVRELQTKLTEAGHDAKADGVFGKGTEQAVRDFQKEQGLDVDGVVGRDTAQALEAVSAA